MTVLALRLRQGFGRHFAYVRGVVGRRGGLQQIVVVDEVAAVLLLLLLLADLVELLLLLLLVVRRRRVMVVLALGVVIRGRCAVDGALLLFALATRLLVDLLHGAQFLLQLHAPVLEPDFDLALRQAEGVRDFDPSSPGQVVIEVELFFQFQRLVARVRLTSSPPRAPVRSCKSEAQREI